jgi:hypothetical protein
MRRLIDKGKDLGLSFFYCTFGQLIEPGAKGLFDLRHCIRKEYLNSKIY